MSRDDGFSLVEMFLMCVLIGALASIAIFQFGHYRDKAKMTQMRSDARVLAQGFELAYSEASRYPGWVLPDPVSGIMQLGGTGFATPVEVGLTPDTTITAYTIDPVGESFTFTISNLTNPEIGVKTWDSSLNRFIN